MSELTKLRGTRNVYIRHLSNLETKIKDITLSTPTSQINNEKIISLRGTKNNFIDKLNKVKELDDKILDILSEKPDDFENELEKNLIREDSYFEIIALADQFLETANTSNVPQPLVASSPFPSNNLNDATSASLPKLIIKPFDGNILNWQTFFDQYSSTVHSKTNLNDIDKFTYLKSLLSEAALETISGLTLTSDNYSEAIELLKNRYGNPQMLINTYMEKFVKLEVITKSNDITKLRSLYNQVETGIRNLRTLNVNPESYGSLLVPVLTSKLPADLRTTFARKFQDGVWDLTEMLIIFRRELEAKERAFSTSNFSSGDKNQGRFTSSALFTSNKNLCVFCNGNHASSKCRKVSNPKARKEILFKNKVCFICFSSEHYSSQCTSTYRCKKCEGRHHISICLKDNSQHNSYQNSSNHSNQNSSHYSAHNPTNHFAQSSSNQPFHNAPQQNTPNHLAHNTSSHLVHNTPNHSVHNIPSQPNSSSSNQFHAQSTHTNLSDNLNNILLQTAYSTISDIDNTHSRKKFILFDSGAQRSYVTEKLKLQLNLEVIRTERIVIKVFGQTDSELKSVDVVRIKVLGTNEDIIIEALVIPEICNSLTNQNSKFVIQGNYPHLQGLRFADFTNFETKNIDVLIGLDYYYNFILGNIRRGNINEPVAIQSTLGWILSGHYQNNITNVNFNQTHFFFIQSNKVSDTLCIENEVKHLWDIESVGIDKENYDVYKSFENELKFENNRYCAKLLFKPLDDVIPDNFNVAKSRLKSLERKFENDPTLFENYSAVINEYKSQGIIEEVSDSGNIGNVHYLPHQPVLRSEKETSKLRIVFDASSKQGTEHSLNELLYPGPCLLPLLFDILLRFRLGRYAITSDIKQAFLQIQLTILHRDFTRFLWFSNFYSEDRDIIIYRFTRILFGLTCSPFILNGTLKHHLKKFLADINYPKVFIEKLLNDLYVDDLLSSFNDEKSIYEFYISANQIFKAGGFQLCKWASNCKELQERINSDNQVIFSSNTRKVLGINWNLIDDTIIFNFEHIINVADSLKCTKRNILKITAMFYDPIGVICPIVLQLKLLFKKICNNKSDWDSLLEKDLQLFWFSFLKNLQKLNSISINRHVFSHQTDYSNIILHGFCDASNEAYSALVYIQISNNNGTFINLLTAKSKIVPNKNLSIPRTELLSCLLLSKLITSVKECLKSEVSVDRIFCWSDSQVALWWIKSVGKVWKIWVENRVRLIRDKVPVDCWSFVPGVENPADLATRANSSLSNLCNDLWFHGPEFLRLPEEQWHNNKFFDDCNDVVLSEESVDCNVLLSSIASTKGIGVIMSVERFGCLGKLLRVTGYVLRFLKNLKRCIGGKEKVFGDLVVEDIEEAERVWLRFEQSFIVEDSSYEKKKVALNLFYDEFNLLRSKTRMNNVNSICIRKNEPILLRNNSYFTKLIIESVHQHVHHGGLSITLTRLRSKYWLVKGRNNVKKVISKCVICKYIHGKTILSPSSPVLPKYRVCYEYPFESVGVDYAGPLFVRDIYSSSKNMNKCYILLFTCATTRCVHLELVSSFNSDALLLCLKRFISRRGRPNLFISDNFKTFKSKEVKEFLLNRKIKWEFILEKSPWWGGFYERLIGIVKSCLKKVVGKSFLNYEEMNTVLIDIEQTLNSRPLTYVEEDNHQETLTPFHLLYGRDINTENISCKTSSQSDDPEYLRNRYVKLKQVISHFKKRFYDEYIISLHERHCYDRSKSNNECKLQKDEVVLIKQNNVPRLKWHKGRICSFIHGNDKLIRGAILKTVNDNGKPITLKRPLQYLIPLEIREHYEPADEPSDDRIDDEITEVVTEEKNRKSRRVAALNADLLRRLNKDS